jgi:hypothetical protein
MENDRLELLKMLAERLERLNVDSKWARRASGNRGAILKALAMDENGSHQTSDDLDVLIQKSLEILTKAAREIPDLEELRKRYFQLEG